MLVSFSQEGRARARDKLAIVRGQILAGQVSREERFAIGFLIFWSFLFSFYFGVYIEVVRGVRLVFRERERL